MCFAFFFSVIEKSLKIFIFPLARDTRVLIYYALVRLRKGGTSLFDSRWLRKQ